MGTFADIKARVRVAVIDLPTAVNSAVDKLVNVAHRDLQDKHDFWIMRATAAYTTTLSTRSIGAVPSDFKDFRDTPYFLMDDDGKVREIVTAQSPMGPYGAINDDDEGFPMVLTRSDPTNVTGSSNFHVWPLPDGLSDYSDGQYRITVPYWKYLPDLAADGDTDWFTVNAEEYIFKRAVAEAFGLDWDEVNMTLWLERAAQELQTVIKKDRKQLLAGMQTLVPHWRGANSPKLRW